MGFEPFIYYCADDFGLTEQSDDRIIETYRHGCLNKISIFPNIGICETKKRLPQTENARLCIHLNLVEGHCVGEKERLPLLTDGNGKFKHTFLGLLMLSVFKRKPFYEQVKLEIEEQIAAGQKLLGHTVPLCLDSHQHTHMIPAVFSALCGVISERGLKTDYLRIPCEPITPFIKKPSLYAEYLSVNVIKQWLLDFFGLINRKKIKRLNVPTAAFFGIMFSGNMSKKRVEKLLPEYIKYAKRHRCNIEVLFHPGGIDSDCIPEDVGIKFADFYLSSGRKNEYGTLMSLGNQPGRRNV